MAFDENDPITGLQLVRGQLEQATAQLLDPGNVLASVLDDLQLIAVWFDQFASADPLATEAGAFLHAVVRVLKPLSDQVQALKAYQATHPAPPRAAGSFTLPTSTPPAQSPLDLFLAQRKALAESMAMPQVDPSEYRPGGKP